jgi:hypothetical protein
MERNLGRRLRPDDHATGVNSRWRKGRFHPEKPLPQNLHVEVDRGGASEADYGRRSTSPSKPRLNKSARATNGR